MSKVAGSRFQVRFPGPAARPKVKERHQGLIQGRCGEHGSERENRNWAGHGKGHRLLMWSTVAGNGPDKALDKDPDHHQDTQGHFGAVPAPRQAGKDAAFSACDLL